MVIITASNKARANDNFDELKSKLNKREAIDLEYADFSDIDYRTQKEKKQDRKKRTNMSKKFGPVKMGVRLRSVKNSNVNLNLDLIEAYDLMNRTQNLQELYSEMQPDQEHTLLGPELRSEIKGVVDKILNFNHPTEKQEGQAI